MIHHNHFLAEPLERNPTDNKQLTKNWIEKMMCMSFDTTVNKGYLTFARVTFGDSAK
jgi:hypothetical protein